MGNENWPDRVHRPLHDLQELDRKVKELANKYRNNVLSWEVRRRDIGAVLSWKSDQGLMFSSLPCPCIRCSAR